MPKSKVRKKNDFTVNPVSRTPVKVKAGPSSIWFVVLFIGLMLIGLAWLLVFQLASQPISVPGRSRPVELRDRLCFHDHRLVAHYALAVKSRTGPDEFILDSARYPFGNLVVINHIVVIHPHWG